MDIIQMPPDLCALVCVYFCKILSYVWICMTTPQSRYRATVSSRGPSCHFNNHITFYHSVPGNFESVFHSHSFVISRILHKCNRTVCHLLRLSFFSHRSSLDIFSGCRMHVSVVCSCLLLSSIPQCGCIMVCFTY